MQNPLPLELVGLQYLLVDIRVIHPKVVEERATACDFAKQSAACGEIFLMFLQVLGEKRDLFGENRDLDLRGTGILIVCAMLLDERFLRSTLDCHREEGDEMEK